MYFDEAIKAHSAWKLKLSNYIRKPDGSLKADEVQSDHKCDLGKWIHGEGMKHKSLADYKTLRDQHATFHKAAADVIRRADSGKSVTEEIAVGSNSDFGKASQAVVLAIMNMKRADTQKAG